MNSKFLFISLFTIFHLQAQENIKPKLENTFKRVIKTQPLHLYAEPRLGYEQQITKNGSLDFYAKYRNSKTLIFPDIFKIHEITLEAGYRYYFTKKEDRLQGWYMRGGITGDYAFANNNDNKVNVFAGGIDAHIGTQVVLTKFLKGLTFDANIGGNLSHVFVDESVRNNDFDFRITGNVSLGYSF